MAKKPPSYEHMVLTPIENETPQSRPTAEVPPQTTATETTTNPPEATPRPRGRTLKEASDPVMLYLHPDGAKALKRYALDQNTKVHSLLLEAVEDWFKRHGLREPVRVDTGRRK
jgi:hypothetical protein